MEKSKLKMFLQDEDGNITKSQVVKAGTIIALGLAPGVLAQQADKSCTCSPGCGSCHANSLSSENAKTEFCGYHCHQIVNGVCGGGGK